MVDENFKLGLEIEFDIDKQLSALSKKIQKAVESAVEQGYKSAGKNISPGSGAGVAASVKSAGAAAGVSGSDFKKGVGKAVASQLSGFGDDVKRFADAVSRLERVLERAKSVPAAGPGSTREERRMAGRARAIPAVQEQIRQEQRKLQAPPSASPEAEKSIRKSLEKLAKLQQAEAKLKTANLQDSRKLEDAQERLASAMNKEAAAREEAARKVRASAPEGGVRVSGPKKEVVAEKQVGAPNIQRGANIDATRAGGSQRTAGGGAGKAAILADAPRVRDGRVGGNEDKPEFRRSQEKSMAARERVSNIQRGGELRVAEVNKSLDELRKAVGSIPGFKGMKAGELFGKLNLPAKAELGTGAVPQIKDMAGQIKVVGGVIEMFGDKITRVSNIVTDRISSFLKSDEFSRIGRTARKDPERAVGLMRRQISDILSGQSDIDREIQMEGRPRKGFQLGGQATLRYKPTEEQSERLSKLKNEAEIIGEVNRIIAEYIQKNEALRNSFKAIGAEGVFSTGLPEQKAADIQIIRGGEGKRSDPIEEIEVPIQTRQLATMGLGEEGGLARSAREFLVSQMADVRGGGAPSVKGFLEEQLQEAGMILKSGFKEFKTALADPDILPEIREDQFLFDPKVVKMAMDEIKSVVVKTAAQGIAPGTKLTKGQVLGTRGEGADLEQVTMDMTGTEATVDRLEKVMVDGVEGVRIVYKELNELISGSKFIERSGIKGIGKSADLEKMGFAPGTGMVMSMEGLAKRHGLRTVAEMMANEIAEATGKGAQEIADRIVEALQTGGQSMLKAVKQVASEFGADNFTGTMKVGGPLGAAAGGNLEVLAGKMAWARAPREGMLGPMEAKERPIDPAAMQALRGRAETAALAEQWQKNMQQATGGHRELIDSLRSLRGELDLTSTSLRKVKPEELKRLPPGGTGSEGLEGTLLDPKMAEAFAMSLPTREGGERLLRVPGAGSDLGQRTAFTTAVGTKMPNDVAVMLDRIAEQAVKAKTAMGQMPLEEGSEAMQEAAFITNKAIRDEVSAIKELGITSAEGAARAEAFKAKLMPIIQAMGGTTGFQYELLGPKGQGTGKIKDVPGSPEDYVKSQPGFRGLLAIQDILAQRAGTVTGKPGRQTRSLEQLGKVHTDVEVLNKVMGALGITLSVTSEAADRAMTHLEKLESQLLEKFTEMASTRKKPDVAGRASMALAAEAGASMAPMGLAMEFRTDVSQELKQVSGYLNQMAAAGQNVGEAAAAFGRISAAQEVDLPSMARDTVLINEKDFQNLIKLFSERLNISQEEAKTRLLRPGLAQRYPITGEQSFMASKLRPVGSDVLPEGKFGVAGSMAVSSADDLAKMLAPLEKLEASLIETASQNNYTGAAAEAAGRQLSELSPLLAKLKMQFIATALNLDFDGDKIAFHADTLAGAGSGIKTFIDQVEAGTVSYRKALTFILAQTRSPGGPGTSLERLEEMFKGGFAKGRTGDLKSAVSWPMGPDKAAFEATAATAPKKSIGLLTDLFNQMYLSVRAGGDQLSDGMSTAIGQMMLGMNEALAQKHGGGGLKGPMEFLDFLKKGQLDEIFSAMDKGEGFFGKLAANGKKMLAVMEKDLKGLASTQGAEGLSKFIEKEGLGIEVNPQDLNKTIGEILQASDLKKMIGRIFEMLKKNMIEALQKGGHTLEEAQGFTSDMLTPRKGGYTPGLNLRMLLKESTPGYAMTRKKGQEELSALDPMERSSEVLKQLSRDVAEEVVDLSESLDPSRLEQAREKARETFNKLQTFLEQLTSGTFGKFESLPGEQLNQKYGVKAVGAFIPGSQTQSGVEGPIAVKSEYIEKIKGLVAVLGQVASGGDINPEALVNLNKQLQYFLGIIEHESIHKASKGWTSAVDEITRSLLDNSQVLGKNARQIFDIMKASASGVAKRAEKVSEFAEIKRTTPGAQVEYFKRKQDEESGEFKFLKERMPVDEALKLARKEFFRSISEELLAYSTESTESKAASGFDKLPQAVQEYITSQLDRLKSGAGAEGDILRQVSNVRDQVSCTILDGLVQAAQGVGPPDIKGQVESLTAGLTEFPDAAKFNRALESLGAHEKAIVESGAVHRDLSDIALGAGGLERRGESKAGVRLGNRPELEGVNAEIKKINEQIAASIGSPEELSALSAKLEQQARVARAKISKLGKDPSTKGEMGGVTGQDEYFRIMREYQRNVAASLSEKARQLQRDITSMRQKNLEQTPEFGGLVNEFLNTVAKLQEYASSTLTVRGAGKGTVASYAASAKGELLPSAKAAGIAPSAGSFEAVLSDVAGEGNEAADFIGRLQPKILQVVSLLKEGEDPLKAWGALFMDMEQDFSTFKTDINKVVEIFSKFARILGMNEGQFSEMAQSLGAVANLSKEAAKSVKNIRVESPADIRGALMGGSKTQRQTGAAALGGDFESSINAQYKEIEKQMEERRSKLQKLVGTEGFKAAGGPKRRFEGQTFEVLDPDSGKVLQKYATEFVRHGNNITATLKQIGAQSRSTGEFLRGSFRRVVQWGFASGAVYGTLRAFRELTGVIIDVQTRMAELQKVMDTSITNFGMLQDAASDMGRTFGIAIEDVIQGMTVYAQQGLEMNEIMERTRATMLAVNVTTLKTDEATEALTSVMKVFSGEMSSSEHAIDAWASVAAKHAVTAADLAVAVQRSGAAAKTAGVGFDDFMGIVTAIGSVTRQSGKEVATGTKFMFRAMRSPKAQKELLNLGILSQDAAGDFRPLMDVLGELSGRWDTLSNSQKLNIAQASSGIRHYNQFLVLMDNWQEALDASVDSQDSQGFAARKSALAMETFAKQMQVLRENVKSFALGIGKVMLPGMTAAVEIGSKLIGVLNLLPDSLKAIGLIGGAGFLAIHKGADLALDTLEAFGGLDFADKLRGSFKSGGIVGALGGAVGKVKGMFGGGDSDIIKGYGEVAPKTKLLAGVMDTAKGAVMGVWTAFKGLTMASRIFALTGVGVIIAAIGGLIYLWNKLPATGDEVSSSLEDQIGKAFAAADAYKKLGSSMSRLGSMGKKAVDASANIQKPGFLEDALASGSFKGPAKLASEYQDAFAAVSQSAVKLDPGMIRGVDEYGQAVIGAGDAYRFAASTAADFEKAQAAAMQNKIIKAYSAEITDANTGWRKTKDILGGIIDFFGQITGLGKNVGSDMFDTSLSEEYKTATQELQKLIDQRKEMLSSGGEALGIENQIEGALERQSELREEILQKSASIKKILEEMPAFQDLEMAKATLGKGTAQALEAPVEAGAFGRGATVGSVLMKQLAKSAGTGGMFDYSTLASPAKTTEGFLERGITPQVSGNMFDLVKATGDVAVVSREAATKILQLKGALPEAGDSLEKAIQTAQSGIVQVDQATGQAVVNFYDNLTNDYIALNAETWENIRGSLGEEAQKTGVFSKKAMAEAMENSRKILTLQFTGAMAGMRQPPQVDIGLGRRLDVSAEQRAISMLQDESQRLGDIQTDIADYFRKINEDMDTEGLKDSSQQIETLTKSMLDMIVSLQKEGFQLSVIANYNKALQDLQLTMEQAADQAKKTAAQERARADAEKVTSGALSGRAVLSELQFGPTSKELTSMQRLQSRLGKPFESAVSEIGIQEKERSSAIQSLEDTIAKEIDFQSMIEDFKTAGESLTKEQMDRMKQLQDKGIDPGQREFIKSIEKGSSEIQDINNKQLEVQTGILQVLETIAKVSGEGDTTKKTSLIQDYFSKKTGGGLQKDISKLSAEGILPADTLTSIRRQMLGIVETGEEVGRNGGKEYGKGAGTFDLSSLSQEKKEQAQEIIDQIVDLENRVSYLSTVPMAPSGKDVTSNMLNLSREQLDLSWNELLDIDEVRSAFEQNMRGKISQVVKGSKDIGETIGKTGKDLQSSVSLYEQAGLKQFDFTKNYLKGIIDEMSSAESKVKEKFRVASAVESFAMAVEGTIEEFKKSEALFYNKIGSDLEGAFARVGQPGFKTQFQNRRTDIEKQYAGRPLSIQEMQERDKAFADVGFDEKEAKIKETQDIETAALREQQGQAERLRSTIADALFGGQLEGAPETQSAARSFMDTLTEQLATSEQARMVGGELKFKGVPGLEDAAKFAETLKRQAETKASEARVAEMQKGNAPLETRLAELVNIQKSMLSAVQKQSTDLQNGTAAANQGALPPGAVQGMAALGPNTPAAQMFSATSAMNIPTSGAAPLGLNTSDVAFVSGYRPPTNEKSGSLQDMLLKASKQNLQSSVDNLLAGGSVEDLAEDPESYTNRILSDYKRRGQRVSVYQPTGDVISEADKEGKGPIDLNKYYTGLSNTNRMSSIAANRYGDASAEPAGLISKDSGQGRTIPGVEGTTTRSRDEAASAQAETLQKILESIQANTELLSGIAQNGLQLPDDFGSQIENIGTSIVDRLGESLSVEITNTPVTVEVDGLEEAFSAAIGTSGLSSVGASVSDALGRLALLETVIDPQGASLEEQISAASADILSKIDETNIDLSTQTERIDELETQVEELPDFQDVSDRLDRSSELLSDLEPRVTEIEASAAAVEATSEDLKERVGDLESLTIKHTDKLDIVDERLFNFSASLDSFQEEVNSFDTRLTSVEDLIGAGNSAASELQESLASLRATVEQNKQALDNDNRSQDTSIQFAENNISSIQQTILTLQRKTESALNVAQQAINRANQK